MENTTQYSSQNWGSQAPLPNATAVLILGIGSLVLCWCYGLFGVITGIIALVLARKDEDLYNANPSFYQPTSYSNLRTGKICAIIGLILSSLMLLIGIIYFIVMGTIFWNAFQQGQFK